MDLIQVKDMVADLPQYVDTKKGDKILKPDNPKAGGYLFAGWYKETECKNKWNFDIDIVEGDITLYASWIKIQENIGDVLRGDIPKGGEIPKEKVWVASAEDTAYTGKAIKPEMHIYWGKERLDEGIDYTLKYKNNTQANDVSN